MSGAGLGCPKVGQPQGAEDGRELVPSLRLAKFGVGEVNWAEAERMALQVNQGGFQEEAGGQEGASQGHLGAKLPGCGLWGRGLGRVLVWILSFLICKMGW